MTHPLFNIENKVVAITGAGGGIGRAVAKGFVESGARLALIENAETNFEALRGELTALNAHVAEYYVLDVTDREGCFSCVEQIVEKFGRVDVLINLAGINQRMRPELYTEAIYDRIVDVNLKGTFQMCQAVYASMKANGYGKIINVGSITAIAANQHLPVYAATKAAINQMSKSLACAWAPEGIHVNVVHPGWIDTALSRQARIDIPGHAERVVATTPAGRWGLPEDLVGTMIFLASPASDFIDGANIVVDGGVTSQL